MAIMAIIILNIQTIFRNVIPHAQVHGQQLQDADIPTQLVLFARIYVPYSAKFSRV